MATNGANGREPPNTNEGGYRTQQPNERSEEQHTATVCLDWLQYSVEWLSDEVAGLDSAFMPHEALRLTRERIPHWRGYDTAYALTQGRVSYHSQRPEQKVNVCFTGGDLAALYDEGVDALELLAYALDRGAKVTRLDFAVDYYGPADVMDMWHAWDAGKLDTKVRNASRVQGSERDKDDSEQGATVYIGAKNADKKICIYNKASQQGVEGPWTRIELRVRDRHAQRLADAMMDEGIGAAGKSAIRAFVGSEVGWYCEALAGPDVYLAPVGRKDTKTLEWLENDVLPVLERELEATLAEGDYRLYDAYMGALAKAIATTPKNGKARNPEHAPNRRDDGTRVFA